MSIAIALCALLLLAVPALAAERDPYGGTTSVKGTKTGFFHVQKLDGRWWLVTPDGNGFLSKGVCNVSYDTDRSPALGYSPYERTNAAKYGSREAWAKAAVERLRGWGLNTIGAWSTPQATKRKMAYTPILDLAAASVPDLWLKGGFPDVYSPGFAAAMDAAAKRLCEPRAKDPWLLGYFTDNELHWGPDWRSDDSVLDLYLKMAEDAPGRKKAEAFLAGRGRKPGEQTEGDEATFLEKAAGEYFRHCKEAVRRHDPNHLILGCRFAGFPPEAVQRAIAKHTDVVSVNNYDRTAPVGALAGISRVTGRPVMVTEFSFKAMDSGLPNSRGAGEPVATQKDRADLWQAYITDLMKMPECVGWHWFEHCDEPKEGRFDGENSNYGLVRIDDTPWETLTGRMKSVNPTLEGVHLGSRG